MFGKDEAIRDHSAIPQYHVDYRERLSDDPEVRWTDRLTGDGTWTANLFQFYQRVLSRLFADLKVPFQLRPDMFRKDETIVHEAIREALVNALIHADYRGKGGIVIEKYRDRITLSNPGSLLLPVEQLFQGGISECRNKSLQLMFQQIGGGEKAGSGIDKIRQGWASQKWRLPLIRETTRPDRVQRGPADGQPAARSLAGEAPARPRRRVRRARTRGGPGARHGGRRGGGDELPAPAVLRPPRHRHHEAAANPGLQGASGQGWLWPGGHVPARRAIGCTHHSGCSRGEVRSERAGLRS